MGVLKKWLEDHYDDFDEDAELRNKLKNIIHSMIDHGFGAWALKSGQSLLKLMQRKQQRVQQCVGRRQT